MLLAVCSEAADMWDFFRVTKFGFFDSFFSQATL